MNHVLYIFVFLQSLVPFLSELAIQGMADACFPETGRSRGLGQVLTVRDQMSRIIEQLVSGKVRVDARNMLLHVQGGWVGVPCETGKNLVRSDPRQSGHPGTLTGSKHFVYEF